MSRPQPVAKVRTSNGSTGWGLRLAPEVNTGLYSNSSGVNAAPTETITWGKKGGTAFLHHLAFPYSGYFDAYVIVSGVELRVTSVQSNQPLSTSITSSNSNYSGVRVDCICSGYDSATHAKLYIRKGRFYCQGLGWKNEYVPFHPLAITRNS